MKESELSSVQLHNMAELCRMDDGSIRPQRYPEWVREQLSEQGQMRALASANMELRWVEEKGEAAEMVLSSEGTTQVMALAGTYDLRQRMVLGSDPQRIRLEPSTRLAMLPEVSKPVRRFHPSVRRLVFWGDPLRIHAVDGEGIRPPTSSELPPLRYLAYGTSITQGSAASSPNLNFAAQTAWHLRADLINLGLGGSAYCEPEVADYIASRDDWDVATLALSVNMVNKGFTVEEFRERTAYMVKTIATRHPANPIFVITLWPYFSDFGISSDSAMAAPDVFRECLREVVSDAALPNLFLLNGPDLLRDTEGLSADLIHPGDHAMIEVGQRLAEVMAKTMNLKRPDIL